MACVGMRPLHGISSAKPASASQFFVVQSKVAYGESQNVSVDITTQSSDRTFKGFLLQAYDPISGQLKGSFKSSEDAQQVSACSAVTHRDGQAKKSVKVVWLPPAKQSGKVRFRATIVVSYSEFYTGFESSELKFDKFGPAAMSSTESATRTATSGPINAQPQADGISRPIPDSS